VLAAKPAAAPKPAHAAAQTAGAGRRMLLVDCEDSFVHTLADYFRQTGAEVDVVRHYAARDYVREGEYDLIGLSPGPGRPDDFGLKGIIEIALERGLPLFGVCLGMQAIGEYFGAELKQLGAPMHGRPSKIRIEPAPLFKGLGDHVVVGRYHSLYLEPQTFPDCLAVTAMADDGAPMALEHKTLPIAAVQFHPESIMSKEGEAGLVIIANAMGLGRRPNM
jgi:anthranilate synthase